MSSRIGKKSLSPSKPPVAKRDSSFLAWHYKEPEPEELEDGYECYTDEEWKFHFQAAKEEISSQSSIKKNPELMKLQAKRLACDGCQLFYQLWARQRGICHPVAGAITPLDKIEVDEDE